MGAQRAKLPAKSANRTLAPLHQFLTAGGDDRIEIDARTSANTYGCTPFPVDETHVFSSSTASSISAPAYDHISRAYQALLAEGGDHDEALRRQVECSRASLMDCLELNDVDAEIVFAPSGTDAQLHALFLANTNHALTTITVGADQTGSGTAFTSKGLHFSAKTARGCAVAKGTPIAGLSDGVTALSISLVDARGKPRAEKEIDAEVCAAVEREVGLGRRVLLQAMDASKFGWRAPSDRCLEAIRGLWPDAVQIVIDACQMRISRPRLKAYLARGFLVLVTGSKFFTGPAFSGAVLVPRQVLERMAATGLEDYARQCDYAPSRHRATLDASPNLGQWLRWEAALQEMRNYYALPAIYRKLVLARLAKQIPALIAQSHHLELLPAPTATPSDLFDDEEMTAPTIFPFLMKVQGNHVGPDDATRVYRALMQDLSDAFPAERHLASIACHIGQPVKIASPSGAPTAAVRLCIGARTLSQMWSSGHMNVGDCVDTVIGRIRAVVQKTELIVAHLDQLPSRDLCAAAPSSAIARGLS